MVEINEGYKIGWFFRTDLFDNQRDEPETLIGLENGVVGSVINPGDLVVVYDDKFAQMVAEQAFLLARVRRFLAAPFPWWIVGTGECIPLFQLSKLVGLVHQVNSTT